MSIHRPELPLSGEHSLPDGYFRVNRCRRCGFVIGYGERCDVCISRKPNQPDGVGEYMGRHHTEWIATVDELLIQGNDDDAEFLLWKLIEAAESETLETGVAPFERHFTRLTQLARRRKDSMLAADVHERYERCRQAAAEAHTRAG
jgi:hypothetical protein